MNHHEERRGPGVELEGRAGVGLAVRMEGLAAGPDERLEPTARLNWIYDFTGRMRSSGVATKEFVLAQLGAEMFYTHASRDPVKTADDVLTTWIRPTPR